MSWLKSVVLPLFWFPTSALETGNLRVRTEVADGFQAFVLAIAITYDEIALFVGFGISLGNHLLALYLRAAVAHAEERCLQDIDVPFLDELWEELQEKGDDV